MSFILSEDDVVDLLDYFYNRAGYISFEFDARLLQIIKRLYEHIKETEKASEVKQRGAENS